MCVIFCAVIRLRTLLSIIITILDFLGLSLVTNRLSPLGPLITYSHNPFHWYCCVNTTIKVAKRIKQNVRRHIVRFVGTLFITVTIFDPNFPSSVLIQIIPFSSVIFNLIPLDTNYRGINKVFYIISASISALIVPVLCINKLMLILVLLPIYIVQSQSRELATLCSDFNCKSLLNVWRSKTIQTRYKCRAFLCLGFHSFELFLYQCSDY